MSSTTERKTISNYKKDIKPIVNADIQRLIVDLAERFVDLEEKFLDGVKAKSKKITKHAVSECDILTDDVKKARMEKTLNEACIEVALRELHRYKVSFARACKKFDVDLVQADADGNEIPVIRPKRTKAK